MYLSCIYHEMAESGWVWLSLVESDWVFGFTNSKKLGVAGLLSLMPKALWVWGYDLAIAPAGDSSAHWKRWLRRTDLAISERGVGCHSWMSCEAEPAAPVSSQLGAMLGLAMWHGEWEHVRTMERYHYDVCARVRMSLEQLLLKVVFNSDGSVPEVLIFRAAGCWSPQRLKQIWGALGNGGTFVSEFLTESNSCVVPSRSLRPRLAEFLSFDNVWRRWLSGERLEGQEVGEFPFENRPSRLGMQLQTKRINCLGSTW